MRRISTSDLCMPPRHPQCHIVGAHTTAVARQTSKSIGRDAQVRGDANWKRTYMKELAQDALVFRSVF